MTKQQIEWAKQHDWFIGHSDEGILVEDQDGIYLATDFNELYIWAGY